VHITSLLNAYVFPLRRFLATTSLARLVLVLILASTDSQAQSNSQQNAVKAVKVADQTWFVEGEASLGSAVNRNFISNAAFVVTREGVVVIDALGSPTLAKELIAQIRHVTRLPIRYLIVTHYHADHIYGLQEFSKLGVTIIAHKTAQEYINSEIAKKRLEDSRVTLFPWIDEDTQLITPSKEFSGASDTLRLGGIEFQLHHVGPAHTPEDLVIWTPQLGVLFAGDLVFRGRIPFVGQADSRQWVKSLDKALAFAPRLIVPGHGPVSHKPLQDLQLTRDYLHYLRASFAEPARNMEPFEEAYAKVDWSRYETLPLFRAANRMNAYNTYLLLEREQ
jgi:glyoxylase-like metal-dependent hydrolase (beta-lactamase superfamily II)